MPRHDRNSSYTPSPKRSKRYRNSSASVSSRHKSKNNQAEKNEPELPVYDINAKSDVKHHVRYNNIRVRSKQDKDFIMEEVKNVLEN